MKLILFEVYHNFVLKDVIKKNPNWGIGVFGIEIFGIFFGFTLIHEEVVDQVIADMKIG